MRREAIRQLEDVIEGFKVIGYWQSIIYGLVDDPLEAVEVARKSLPMHTPILRMIPVNDVVRPYIDAVKRSVHSLLSKWPEGSVAVRIDGYIMDESGRFMHRRDAAIAIMEGVERPVNLKNPDVLIYVKVTRLGRDRVAAIYVGPPRGILSIVKEARQA
jgi:tRNA acetyltransferase TAN1